MIKFSQLLLKYFSMFFTITDMYSFIYQTLLIALSH